MKLCLLQIINIEIIKGFLVKEEGVFSCPGTSKVTNNNILKAIDRKLSIIYINNYSLDSGLKFYNNYTSPLYNMTICSTNNYRECDPTCYMLEGYCNKNKSFTIIQ